MYTLDGKFAGVFRRRKNNYVSTRKDNNNNNNNNIILFTEIELTAVRDREIT